MRPVYSASFGEQRMAAGELTRSHEGHIAVIGRGGGLRRAVGLGVGSLREELGPEPHGAKGIHLVAVGREDLVHLPPELDDPLGERGHGIEIPERAPAAAGQVAQGAFPRRRRVPGAEDELGTETVRLPAEDPAAPAAEPPAPAEGVEHAGVMSERAGGPGQGLLGAICSAGADDQDAHG